MLKTTIKLTAAACLAASLLFSSGCATQQSHSKTSVVDYLYPEKNKPIIADSIPVLKLPVSVGIAFVPESSSSRSGFNFWSNHSLKAPTLTAVQRKELLDKVGAHFQSKEFIGEIQTIPAEYLTPRGSFTNLDQIRSMYGIDLIALVSYDQTQFTDSSFLSLTYWTLIGAYVVEAEENDTSTMMDTVVYDIASRKMLFRAPGTSLVKGSSSPVNLPKELRKDSLESFNLATDKMIVNLDSQLEEFKQKIKANPEQVKVEHKAGYSGGGSASLYTLLIMSLFLLSTFNTRKPQFSIIKRDNTND
jgi:rhombotail lipoprotein